MLIGSRPRASLVDGGPGRRYRLGDHARPVGPDSCAVESLVVHREAVAGRAVVVETALVTGGIEGSRRQPVLEAAWPLGDGRWS
jgi:hypothetical protein